MNKTQDVKSMNISAVVRIIQKNGPVSKNSIASQLGLTIMTVNNLVTELCNVGICCESGKFVSNGGRRAALYQLKGDYGYIIGVDMARTHIRVALFDMKLKKIYDRAPISCDLCDVGNAINLVKREIKETKALHKGKIILGVGVAIPGSASKVGINIPEFPQWRSVDLAGILSESVKLPVYVDNDTNALALCAKWSYSTGGCSDFVFMTTDGGIGAGVVINDSIFYGSNSNGSEIGHTILHPGGRKCKCGLCGCVETYACVDERISEIEKDDGAPCADIDEAVEMYKKGNSKAIEIFEEASLYLATTFINTAKLYDPELIMFENKWLREIPLLYEKIQNIIYSSLTNQTAISQKPRLSVVLNRKKEITDSAAAAIVFEKFMQEPMCDAFCDRIIV